MPEARLVCIGNLTVDETVSPTGTRTESIGGDALYAALGARLAGGHPRILAPLGDDAPAALLDAVGRAGTDPAALPRRDAPTIRNVVEYRADGSRSWELVLGEVHMEELSVEPYDVTAPVLAADGILMSAMALGRQIALATWIRPRTRATIYFDPQEDYVAGNEQALFTTVSTCDVFLPSEVEAIALAGTEDLAAAIELFLSVGPSTVVVKRAEAGCLVATREYPRPVAVPADPVTAIDSTGAGDAFCGAFAAEHLRSRDAVAAAVAGTAAARVAVSGHGLDPLLAAAGRAGADR